MTRRVAYLLDTDTCIYLLNGNPSVKARVDSVGVGCISVSTPTVAEIYFGALHPTRIDANCERIRSFLVAPCPSLLQFDLQAAERFGRFKSDLRRRGITIGDVDLMIAGIAATRALTVVTNNIGHFEKIPEISVVNWLTP